MTAPPAARPIGTIVNSTSHIDYWCQVYGQHEIADPPNPSEYPFGQFVGIALPPPRDGVAARGERLIGVIYDTVLMNPAFGALGPRLSTSDEQRAVFSPDYLTERATLVKILALGVTTADSSRVIHGVPALALELGAPVTPLDDEAICAFHIFADGGAPGGEQPYLHMGYLPQLIGEHNSLLQHAALAVLERLRRLLPAHERVLSIIGRNLAWKLSVETAG
jgi:hypothetical protein